VNGGQQAFLQNIVDFPGNAFQRDKAAGYGDVK